MTAGTYTNLALAGQLLEALDALSGLHPGFRPAHAKGLMCSGTFTPSREAAGLTRAPHASRPSTPVTIRYSDSTGLPTIPDNDRGVGASHQTGWTALVTRLLEMVPSTQTTPAEKIRRCEQD